MPIADPAIIALKLETVLGGRRPVAWRSDEPPADPRALVERARGCI
jgi:hypothetical protein